MEQLESVLPPKYAAYAALLTAAVPVIGRAYHAIVNDGGILGIWRSVVFGQSTPVKPTPDTAVDKPAVKP